MTDLYKYLSFHSRDRFLPSQVEPVCQRYYPALIRAAMLNPRDVSSDAQIEPPLSQAVGYVVVVVIGFVIAIVMVLVTRLMRRTVGEDNRKTEMFMTANRSVRTGLTASAVISSWLWSTAMLGSSFVGYNFGLAGPFWFAAG